MTLLDAVAQRDGSAWLTVLPDQWRAAHEQALQAGYERFEWLTAVDSGGIHLVSTLSNAANELLVVRCVLTADGIQQYFRCDALDDIYVSASFHQREVAQMFGVEFVGASDTRPAFEVQFDGFPLRREFALPARLEKVWPGADEAVARRPTPVPGVLKEWTS